MEGIHKCKGKYQTFLFLIRNEYLYKNCTKFIALHKNDDM